MADGLARIFVSFTARDLAAHADVVCAVLRKLQVLAIDHRDAGAQGDPSVAWCRRQVEQCDIVIVLVAHRYGWVPPVDEGGDGQTSITWLEVKHARQHGKTVLPYLIAPDAPWRIDLVEPLQDVSVGPRLDAFKRELGRHVAGFFTDAESLDGPVSRNVRDALDELRRARSQTVLPPASAAPSAAGEPQLRPWIFSRDTPPSVAERWLGSHPKRVLCLDASGAESALMLAWLERLERLLQVRYGEADFRLADYFDLIAGSGVGAVVAAGLARGDRMDEVGAMARELVGLALSRPRLFLRALLHGHSYDPGPMAQALARRFGSAPMAGQRWRTGVALVGARLEVGLPCHYDNAPPAGDASTPPGPPLDALLLGCVSQLSYCPPVLLPGPDGTPAALVQADIVGAANPSLYVLVQLTGERFRWRLGRHQLRVVSVGGLVRARRRDPQEVAQANLIAQITLLTDAMIHGTAEAARTLLHGLSAQSDSPLDFHRFEVREDMSARLGEIGALEWSERLTHWDELAAIGREIAAAGMPPEFLSPAFDVRLIDAA